MKPSHIKRTLKSKVLRLSFSLLTSSIFCVAFLCLGDAQPSAAQDDTQTSELYKLQAAYLWSAKTLSDPSRLNVALLHPELSQAATLFLGLKMLLIAKAFSPDRVFADNKPDRRDQAARS